MRQSAHHSQPIHFRLQDGPVGRHLWGWFLLLVTISLISTSAEAEEPSLRSRYLQLEGRLQNNSFGRPIVLESTDEGNVLEGKIYARVAEPESRLSDELSQPSSWCSLLLLHPNVAQCKVSANAATPSLEVDIGRKLDSSLNAAYRVTFQFEIKHKDADSFEVQLSAKDGPLATSDYLIRLRVIALDRDTAFLALSYSYRYGLAARVAANAYLATTGRKKIGFTVVGQKDGAAPEFIAGLRGAIERNAMRYYLAIDAYFKALAVPEARRVEQSLNLWFDSVEEFAPQLKDDQRADYLKIKRAEYARQNN